MKTLLKTCVLCSCLLLVACDEKEKAEMAKGLLEQTQVALNESREAAIRANDQSALRKLDEAQRLLNQGREIFIGMVDPVTGTITPGSFEQGLTSGAAQIATTIGGPIWGPVAGLGVGLVLGFVNDIKRRRELKTQTLLAEANEKAAREIVNSIDAGRMASPVMAAEMAKPAVKEAIQSQVKSDEAKEIVATERISITSPKP